MRRRLTVARLATVALFVTVGLAFADASVVALALAELYADFDTTIVGVSWVLTAYAVTVALVALLLAVVHHRIAPRSTVMWGAAVFGAASVAAGLSTTLGALLASRVVQGAGAALLLAGSLPLLVALAGPPARRWWGIAGAAGTAAGPALGGLLTEVFTWRAIFLVQAPVAALALVGAALGSPRGAGSEQVGGAADARSGRQARRGTASLANVGFALLFAALVAALFLGVLLVVDVWRYRPLVAALLVTALPVGMGAGRLAAAAPAPARAAVGAATTALGLLALGLLPGEQPVIAALALASCGAGFDLLHGVLDASAVAEHRRGVRAASVSIAARHAGLALGLLVIAPILAPSIERGVDRATLGATRTMLDSDLALTEKLPIAWDLRGAIQEADRGELPDLAREFDERGAADGNGLAVVRDELVDTVTDALTRAFRSSFVVAAALAALAGVPALLALQRRGVGAGSPSRSAAFVLAGLLVLGGAVVATDLVAGGIGSGDHESADPCAASPRRGGDGVDAAVQRIVLAGLDGAACELGTSREVVVLSIDPDAGVGDVRWDHDTIEDAVRSGAHRAIDDAVARDEISGLTATAVRFVVDHTPIEGLLDALAAIG